MCVVAHRAPERAADVEYVDLFFTVDNWIGTPPIGEPDKCAELLWTTPHELPPDATGNVNRVLLAYVGD